MKTDYCAYPPGIAADVEIAEQRDGDRPAFIISSASVGRYLLLRTAEYRVLRLLGEKLTPAAVCDEFMRRHGGALRIPTLTRFLTRLDEIGILAGERVEGHQTPERQLNAQFYTRFKIFNPDPFFTRMVAVFRWVWTTQFFVVSLLLMFMAALLALMNGAEVAHYGGYILREHFIAVLIAGLLVGVTHEFAHGLTCKAFGGRATEVGVLMIYYFLPALYCNVSGIHLIPQRRRRLWVIAAGVYWQLLAGTLALLAWLMLAPYTPLADLAFCFFLGSVLDVAFNGNPLIKLDGYYFLRLLTLALALFYARRPLVQMSVAAVSALLAFMRNARRVSTSSDSERSFHQRLVPGATFATARATDSRMEANMATQDQTTQTPSSGNSGEINAGRKSSRWRRRLVPLAIALFIVLILCLPWNASVGAYGALVAVPGQEAIIRAPESATLIELRVRPGDLTAGGAVIGRMSDIGLEEHLAYAQVELDRANAGRNRLLGELMAREESIARAELNLRQRQRDYDESDSERRQIEERERAEPNKLKYLTASISPTAPAAAGIAGGSGASAPAVTYPAAIAVLQSDADLRQARLSEAVLQLDRTRRLHAQGIAPRSELEKAETNASTLTIELTAALKRLEAFLIEHRRRHAGLATEMQLARSDAGAERLQAVKLNGELRAVSALISTLTDRRDLLRRRLAQFELVTPRPGAVFGEELPRLVGKHFPKGAEICRVADTRQLLARIQASEREIGDVRVGHPVRLKVGAYPDHVFRGRVAKIGGESETDQNDRVIYRVELVIENADDLLRPGMTAFARIDFGRRMIGSILVHKLKQALRLELWMF